MSLEQLVSSYGYAGVVVGTFLEGETALVIGGFFAHLGYLTLPGVMAAAFLGALLGDHLFFHLGRTLGAGAVAARPRWRERSQRMSGLLHKHQNLVILGIRFAYGMRGVTLFAVGASGVGALRFLVLDAVAAACWAVAIGLLGYSVGRAAQLVLGGMKGHGLWLAAALAGVAVLVWLVRLLNGTRRRSA